MNRPLVIVLAALLTALSIVIVLLLRDGEDAGLRPSPPDLEDSSDDGAVGAARRQTLDDEPEMRVTHGAVADGTCAVTGRIVDSDTRRPLVGATLVLRTDAGDDVNVVERASTARGRFEFASLAATREGWLVASARDRGTRVVGPFALAAGDALDVGVIALGPGGRVHGRVLDPTGAGVPGAEIALREVAPPRIDQLLLRVERMFERRPPAARATTGPAGRYEIPGVPRGIWHAAVTADGYATLHRTDVWIHGKGLPTRLDFRLVDGERLRGRVVDEDGRPLEGARVCVVPALNGRDLSIIVRRHHAVTDADGRFELGTLEAGDVEVLVSTAAGRFARKRRVDVPADDVVVVVGGARALTGTVTVAATGELLRDVEVVVTDAGSMTRVRTDAEGVYVVDDLGGKDWKVHVTHPRYVVTDATRRAEGKGDLVRHDIEVEVGFTVRGRVLDATTSRPVADAIVFAPRDDMAGLTQARTGRDGRYELPGVKPGRHRILARAGGYGFNPEDQSRRHPEVEGFADDVVECADILLARSVRVRGLVVTRESGRDAPVAGARVTTSPYGELQARMLGTRSENTVSDRDGRFELESSWTVNGFLHVRASHPDHASRVVVAEGVKPDDVLDVVVEMDRGVVADGVVRDAAGLPLQGVRVMARFNAEEYDVHHEQLRERFGFLARTDSSGRYSMRLPRTPGYLMFERSGHVQLTPGPLPYDPAPGTAATTIPLVVFERAQRVFGAVVSASGVPWASPVVVEIKRASPDGLTWTTTAKFASGASIVIANVPRGLFDVIVRDGAGKELGRLSGVPSGSPFECRLP